MEITIDLERINEILALSPLRLMWYFFTHGGWLVYLIVILAGLFELRLFLKRKKYLESIPQTLLAIDIPKDNEQSLVAVEQIFATLAGIKSSRTKYETYWLGKTQLSLSLEIISLEGYIQFLIRTPSKFRDLVEAAIYAQYPEAEITEVEDYIGLIPDDIHKGQTDYKLWGSEFNFAKHSAYPIRTYRSFEHPLSQIFADPMASLLEVMSKLRKGEQIGFQLIIAPAGDDWKKKGEEIVKKLVGAKTAATKNTGDKLVEGAVLGLEKFSEAIYKIWGDIDEPREDTAHPTLYQFLTTNQKMVVENIENKLAKICFSVSFRVYYMAHKDVFEKGRGINALLGAINQFNTSDLNAFKKFKRLTTHRDYFFVRQRVARVIRKLMKKLYKKRSRKGSPEFMLSIEELATLYHFPTITVKAPLLKKAEVKKAEPPMALPWDDTEKTKYFRPVLKEAPPEAAAKEEAPEEKKYIIKESLPGYDFDSDYFEERFAKSKKTIKTPSAPVTKKAEPPANLPFEEE